MDPVKVIIYTVIALVALSILWFVVYLLQELLSSPGTRLLVGGLVILGIVALFSRLWSKWRR